MGQRASALLMRKYEAILDRLDTRMEIVASGIAADAAARCPVRKQRGDRRRGTRQAFLPKRQYTFGSVTLSTAEIARAAARVGRNLQFSAAARQEAYGKPLQIITRRPRRRALSQAEWERRARQRARLLKLAQAQSAREARQRTRALKKASSFQAQYGRHVEAIGRYEDSPGKLKRSIHVDNDSGGTQIRYAVRADATRQDGQSYAKYVEFPTYKTAAQPFMLPALKAGKGRMKGALTRKG